MRKADVKNYFLRRLPVTLPEKVHGNTRGIASGFSSDSGSYADPGTHTSYHSNINLGRDTV